MTVIAWPGTADADARRPAVGNGSGGRMLPLPLSEAQRVDLFGPWSARVDCPLFLGLFHLEPVTTGPAGR